MPFRLNVNTIFPVIIPNATESSDGIMSAADKTKLDSLTPGGTQGGATTASHIPYATAPNTLADSGLIWDPVTKTLTLPAGSDIDGDSLTVSGGTNSLSLGPTKANIIGIAAGQMSPSTGDGGFQLGISARRWSSILAWWHDTKLGAQLVAAATITPTYGLHHVTGATQIDTIDPTNVPAAQNVMLTLIADGGTITISAAGNVATAFTIAQNKAAILVWDATAAKWYVVQGG